MKKIISKNLYIRSLKELIYTAVIMTALAIAILFMKNNQISYDLSDYFTSSKSYNPIDGAMFFAMLFGSFALSYVSLWFSRDKKKADYVYSLPYTKGQIYASKFAAAITMQFAALLSIMLFGVIVSFGIIGKITFLSDMLIVMLNAMIGSLVVIGAMFVSASITGKALSTTLLAAFLIVLPALPFISKMSIVGRSMDADFRNVYLLRESIYIIPNFFYSISRDYGGLRDIASLMFTFILGCSYTGVGYFLFIRRSGELTGTHTKNTGLHLFVMGIVPMATVYWLTVTTPIGIGSWPAETKTTVLFLILGLMFAILYEVIVNRTPNKIIRCFLVLVCGIIFVAGIHYPVAAKTKYDMERTIDHSEVESINFINDSSVAATLNANGMVSYGEHLVSSIDITDEEIIEFVLSMNDITYNEDDYDTLYLQLVKFNLDSGKSVYKNIPFYFDGDAQESDVDIIFGDNPEYYEYLYAAMPPEHVTFICTEYELETFNNQKITKSIYENFFKEYNELSKEEKGKLKHYIATYLYHGVMGDVTNAEMFIGLLCVNGRVDNMDVVDIYKITRETEQAANNYMQAANDVNFLDFGNMYYGNKDNNQALGGKLELYVLYFDEENSGEILFGLSKRNFQSNIIPIEQEYYIEALNILLSGDITAPKADDAFVKIVYYDNNTDSQRVVFVPFSTEQIEKISELQEEMMK